VLLGRRRVCESNLGHLLGLASFIQSVFYVIIPVFIELLSLVQLSALFFVIAGESALQGRRVKTFVSPFVLVLLQILVNLLTVDLRNILGFLSLLTYLVITAVKLMIKVGDVHRFSRFFHTTPSAPLLHIRLELRIVIPLVVFQRFLFSLEQHLMLSRHFLCFFELLLLSSM
jgi:hypothetical protein